jgi:hypothetical protein
MSTFRKVIRFAFYVFLTLMLMNAAVYLCIVVVWISLGLHVSPARFARCFTCFISTKGLAY